jgi:hypothetical protein
MRPNPECATTVISLPQALLGGKLRLSRKVAGTVPFFADLRVN